MVEVKPSKDNKYKMWVGVTHIIVMVRSRRSNLTEEPNTDHFYCWITKGPQQSSPVPHRGAAACMPAFPHSSISPFLALGPDKTGAPKQAWQPRSQAPPHSDTTKWSPWWLFPHHFVPYVFQLSHCSFMVQSHLFSPLCPLNTLPLIFLNCYYHR